MTHCVYFALPAGGKYFDPFQMAAGSPAVYKDYKQKEVKNGRLAMIAQLGFWSQYAATGKGPIENLQAHLADPTHVTVSALTARFCRCVRSASSCSVCKVRVDSWARQACWFLHLQRIALAACASHLFAEHGAPAGNESECDS